MDIRCERCATEYELDEAQVPEAGVSIKCASCGHVFKVSRPAPPPVVVRTTRNGKTSELACPDEDTLVKWVREGTVTKTDTISFDGASWLALGEMAELADAFAAAAPKLAPAPAMPAFSLPEETPKLHGSAVQTAASLPSLNLPTDPPAPKLPSLNLPDATVPDLPKLSLPADPPTPTKFESRTRGNTMPPPSKNKAEPPRPGTASSDTSASLGKLNRSVEGAPPVASSGAPVLPSLNLPTDTVPTMPPVAAPKAAAKETAPVPATTKPATAPAKPPPLPPPSQPPPAKPSAKQAPAKPAPATPPAPKVEKAPEKKPEKKPAKAESDFSETDAELAAFKQQGRGGRIAAGVLIGAAVVGGGGYAIYSMNKNHVPDEAKAAYSKGRDIYLADVRSKFPEADAAFEQAIQLAGSAPYADAWAARAELQSDWAEQLSAKGGPLADQATQKSREAKAAPENQELHKQADALAKMANMINSEAQEHQQKAADFVQKAMDLDHFNVAASRTLLTYYRVSGNSEKTQKEIARLKELLKGKPMDPETQAAIAVADAVDQKDARQLASDEATIQGTLKDDPKFVHAWLWLANVHKLENKVGQALLDLEKLSQVAPGHDGAADLLAQWKPGAPQPAAVVTTTAEPAKPAPAKAEPRPEPAKPAVTASKAEKPESKPAEPPPANVNVDKLVEQGNKLLDRSKNAQALEVFDKALAAKPNVVDALLGRAVALSGLGKSDQSIAAFRKTLEVSPKHGDALIGLAEELKKKGQTKEAVKYYQRYLDVSPKGEYAKVARDNIAALR